MSKLADKDLLKHFADEIAKLKAKLAHTDHKIPLESGSGSGGESIVQFNWYSAETYALLCAIEDPQAPAIGFVVNLKRYYQLEDSAWTPLNFLTTTGT